MAGFNDWLEVTDPKLMAESIAERFRLSQNELMKAQEALAPAFALGLQRAMASPKAWTDLAAAFSAMVPGATPAQRTLPGQTFLDAFFGSDALAGAVARQASLFAGIAPDTIQKLMPSLAMLTMETMVRTTMANLQRNQPQGLTTGDFGGATAEMMRRGANAVEALSRPSDAPGMRAQPASPFAGNVFADSFSEAMRASLSWMHPTPAAPPRPAQSDETQILPAFNPMLPFAAMFDAFAKGMQTAIDETGGRPTDDPAPDEGNMPGETAPAHAAVPDEVEPVGMPAPGDDLVGELMRSGQKFQEDYAKEMASLFDRYQRAAP